MRSLTPLAEYLDMLYTRMATELDSSYDWHIELHPPFSLEDGTGQVVMRGRYNVDGERRIIAYRANMHAVQQGAEVSTEALEQVVDIHVANFKKGFEPKESEPVV